ncbi:siderophore ABC transporter substrate-binding protein [Reinekea marina]|uniref:Siderophore ABC transporter substrate-binding protein n=1 Tax=Reinekea marina TaxID=1310421 RepID=A0ABV7WQX3_9GAMM|nr:siderophore ABC transporter substrate-binding protein [Reinekea marina]MDN3648187.1 siderophore ABC transporter substrate-binding protein [Reinekea marina]
MLKYPKALILGCFALMTYAVAGTLVDAQGKFEMDKTPEKIVTFGLAPLDTFDTLGVKVIGVTKPHTIGYLSKFKDDQYANVGSFFEPDVEMTASLEPDVIVLGPRTAAFKEQFSEFAPTFDSSVWGENYLQQFYSMTESLAKMVDKEAEAKVKLDAIKAKVRDIQQAAPNAGKALFVLTSGGKISAFGPGSRYGWVHDDLGLIPAVDNVEEATHGEPISFEFIKDADPDWLIVLDRDAAIGTAQGSAQALLDNDIIKSMDVHKQQNIIYVDGVSWYLVAYGLTAVDSAVSQLHKAIVN